MVVIRIDVAQVQIRARNEQLEITSRKSACLHCSNMYIQLLLSLSSSSLTAYLPQSPCIALLCLQPIGQIC